MVKSNKKVGQLGITRRGLLKAAPATLGGTGLLAASGLLPSAGAQALTASHETPGFDALVRAQLDGTTIRCGFTPPILSEFFNIMEHACFRQAHSYSERFGVNWEWQRASPSGNFDSVEGQYNIIQNWIYLRTRRYLHLHSWKPVGHSKNLLGGGRKGRRHHPVQHASLAVANRRAEGCHVGWLP